MLCVSLLVNLAGFKARIGLRTDQSKRHFLVPIPNTSVPYRIRPPVTNMTLQSGIHSRTKRGSQAVLKASRPITLKPMLRRRTTAHGLGKIQSTVEWVHRLADRRLQVLCAFVHVVIMFSHMNMMMTWTICVSTRPSAAKRLRSRSAGSVARGGDGGGVGAGEYGTCSEGEGSRSTSHRNTSSVRAQSSAAFLSELMGTMLPPRG